MTTIISGHIKDYDVLILEDTVVISYADGHIEKRAVPNYGTSIGTLSRRPGFALGWASFADFEVLYFYDKGDEGFGYAVNLADDGLSEWGYSPFGG